MLWKIKSSHQPTSLEELKSQLLESRQIADQKQFFHPTSPELFTPADVGIDPNELAKAVARLQIAKEKQEEVVIFGDYDVDGISSTAILWEALRAFGIMAHPFIPDRIKHGYGLSLHSLEAVLAEHKPTLLLTVDNGIVAHDAFAELQKLKIDAILTDHHQPEVDVSGEEIFPPALAVIHTTQLCGSTVAWFLARELSLTAAQHSLDLTAIATVADQMPMLAANRSFVVHGLKALKKTKRIGLQLLCARAGIPLEELTVGSINYAIGPRINAMGRLKHGLDALRLLCTKKTETAELLVTELNDTNSTRQELTGEMIDHAVAQAESWKDQHIIVVASDEYHEGVVGLIAGKLMETYAKPAIVISVRGGFGKASARSIPGVNIIELIRQVKDDLLEAGGHPMAAGFGVSVDKIELVTRRLQQVALELIPIESLVPSLEVESWLPAELLTLEAAEAVQEFSPFGQMNHEPVFGFANMKVLSLQKIGQGEQHLKLFLQSVDHEKIKVTGLAWGKGALADSLELGQVVEVAGLLSINEWKNRKSVQLIVKDVR